MADIFISYSSEDRARARPLATALESLGWSVWWDRKIPAGKTFAEVIEEALTSSRCVIVLWSHAAVKSQWVREEADEGKKRGKLVPVLVEQVAPPMGFRAIHAADLVGWDGTTATAGFQQLVADLTALLGAAPKQATTLESHPIPEPTPAKANATATNAPRTRGARWAAIAGGIAIAVVAGGGIYAYGEMQRRDADRDAQRKLIDERRRADEERLRKQAELAAAQKAIEERRSAAADAARKAEEEQRREADEAARVVEERQKAAEAARKAEEERRHVEAQPADLCRPGFVWREARSSDHVCVDPRTRVLVQEQNRRRVRLWTAGPYGPHTCVQGYVWREAFSGDDVCVEPRFRDQTRRDNAEATRRVAGLGGSR
jgi:hypothetical protein